MTYRRTCIAVLTLVLVTALAAGSAAPARAATTSLYASGWTVNNNADWTPFPPATNPLGAPDVVCVDVSTPTGSWAEFTFGGFGIPGGDTVTGIEVRVNYVSISSGNTVQLTNGGSLVGSSKSVAQVTGVAACSSAMWVSAGGAGDLWGTSLTTADFNAGNVGFRLTQNSNTIGLDAVEIIVHHGGANPAPTADAGGPYVVAEGASVVLDASGSSDPDQSTASLTFEWDLDNDTAYDDATGIGPTFSAAGKDGQGVAQTIGVKVTDSAAAFDTAATTITINNVAPSVAAPTVSPEPSEEGASATASATFTDPAGSLDAPFSCTVDYDTADLNPPVAGTVSGFGCTGPSHVYGDNGTYTVMVTVIDKDGDSGSSSASHQVTNVAPTVDVPEVTPEPSEEGSPVSASATFSDPGSDDSAFTCTVDYGEGDGAVAGTVTGSTCVGPSHSYGDNGTYNVTVCVTDKDSGEGCESSDHEVENVAPTVATPGIVPEPSDEGSAVTASATFTDPGEDDSPFTCTVDFDTSDAVDAVAGTVTGMTCTGDHTYGDNGTFNVEICVTDKDDGEGCAASDHVVDNVAPDAQLDTGGAITFPSGDDAFIGRQGEEQSHDADADDPGSDDLTFAWDFGFPGSTTTYYNDTGDPSGTPDPFPSPGPFFPFSASDTASVTFANPGVYTVRVDVTDDDGGSDFDDLPKLVTGSGDCAYSQGFWRHQFRGRGKPHFDTPTLQAYLDLVNVASGVFSEQVAAAIPAEAQAVFAPGGSFYDKAVRQALAAWLNWASGGVAWNEEIDLDGDLVPDIQFSALIAMVEAILLDPGASHADLELAKDLAEAVNLLDESSSGCEPRASTRPIVVDR